MCCEWRASLSGGYNIPIMQTIRAIKNPIIPQLGVCDPHIHIFNHKAYLYASHDFSPNATDYVMKDWHIWSSPDLVTWSLESVFRPEDTYIGPSSSCWATDAAERHGRYYFYFSNATTDTGVAVSAQPGGPFRDALGGPLLREGLTPTRQYDPAVFIDDDEARTPYIIFGTPMWANGDSYYIARLNDDMVSLAEAPRKVIVDDGADDKPALHKHNGRYYLSWASFYAVSDSVYGPYKLIGNVGASPDHGNFFEWNNQWFQAFTVLDPTLNHRASGICYVHYHADGQMAVDPLIVEYGVGHYDARWNKIEAEWYMAADGIVKSDNPRRGFDVVAQREGSWMLYPNVEHMPANARLCFYAASNRAQGCTITVHADAPDGVLLGTCVIDNTRSWDWFGYRTFVCDLAAPAPVTNLCLVFHGAGEELAHLDWFKIVA